MQAKAPVAARIGHALGVVREVPDPMRYPELLDALAAWVTEQRPRLQQQQCVVVARDQRISDKWCGTVEIEGPQRAGYLSVWSSGELDAQVLRDANFYVLNEHRLARSPLELERALAAFLDVVGYVDPRESLPR